MIDAQAVIKTVTLKVADLAKMTDFYQKIIGLQVRDSTCKFVALGTERQDLVILRHRLDGQVACGATGLYHIALRLPQEQELAHWFRHYLAAGTPGMQGASDHQISHAIYLVDPEGNGIEMGWDTPEEEWAKTPDGQLGVMTYPLNLRQLQQEAPSTPWKRLSPATRIGHIHLRIADTEAARAFYVDLLGFHVTLAVSNYLLFVAAGSYHHHIGLNTWESAGAAPPPENAYGLESFSIGLSCSAEYKRLVERLHSAAYPLEENENRVSIYDPSGNAVHLEVIRANHDLL